MPQESGSQPQSNAPQNNPPANPEDELELKQREAEALLRMMDEQIARKRRERSSGSRRGGIGTMRIAAILLLVILLLASWFTLATLTKPGRKNPPSQEGMPDDGR